MDGATSMRVYVDKLQQLTTLTEVAEISKRKRKGCWTTSIHALEQNIRQNKVQQAYVLIGNRVTDRISIPTRDLPQAVLVYCWRLAGDWARGSPGRRVHGVGKQASSGSGFHREDG